MVCTHSHSVAGDGGLVRLAALLALALDQLFRIVPRAATKRIGGEKQSQKANNTNQHTRECS